MGTEIYLEYDEQAAEEKTAQAECLFESTRGDIGYLRAAIWMHEENGFLRRLFPQEIWDGAGAVEYDFDENYEKFKFLAEEYLLGTSMELPEQEELVVFREELLKLVEKAGGQVMEETRMTTEEKVKWLGSVNAFFDKGHQLQREKKHPRVEIIW